MKKISSLVLLIALIFSCSEPAALKEVAVCQRVIGDRLLVAEIECETQVLSEAYLQELQKALDLTKAVEHVSLKAMKQEQRAEIQVAFDKNKINVKKLIGILEGLADRPIYLAAVKTESYTSGDFVQEEKCPRSRDDIDAGLQVQENEVKMPNLLEVFSRMIRG